MISGRREHVGTDVTDEQVWGRQDENMELFRI